MQLSGEDSASGRGYDSSEEAARLRSASARRGYPAKVRRQPVGEPVVRPVAYAHGWDVAGKLSRTASDARAARRSANRNSGLNGAENDFCDLGGRVAVHAERRAAVTEEDRLDHGGH